MGKTDLKILAIDDNRDNLMTLKAVVSDRLPESRLLTALDGAKGLELALAEDPAVILLDIVMPGMDGYAVCRELKKDKRLRTIPVLFLTALKTDRDSRIKALEAGAEGFLSKPLDEVELIAQIRAMAKIKAANQLQRLEKTELAAMVVERTRELEQELVERRRAEEALRESEARLRLSVAASNIGLWDWNLVTNEVYFSPEWKNQLGYTEDEISNHFEEWQSRIHPDDLAPALARMQSFIADPSSKYATEFRLRHKDGSYRWILAQGQIFRDTAGKSARMMGCHIDITDQKRLETQYLHAQKMESIGTLAGGVAHDFNNILTVIGGLGQITLMKMADDNPYRGNIGGILEATERATHLTKELLLFSRKQGSERHPVDLNDIIDKTGKFLHRIIGEDILLKRVPHDLPLLILADSNQLEQVLMNLAVNARDAMPQGGEFILRTDEVVLDGEFIMTHGYGQPGTYAFLTVADTGTGMNKATQQRIFEPFFSTKEVGKGTGLGLSVVYGIIKQHDGFITVDSEPDQGSTFRIYLPLTTAARQETGEEEEGQPVAGGTETILLAEDNDLVRDLVTNVLTEAGYTVIGAGDGAEAVRKFREHADSIQLLLFDLIMPKMNGKEAADEIHKMQPEMKTIFASGYSPDIAQQKTFLDDRTHLIFKPVSPRNLLKKVRNVLDGTLHN